MPALVMVLDDDFTDRAEMHVILEGAGYTVMEASSVTTALDILSLNRVDRRR